MFNPQLLKLMPHLTYEKEEGNKISMHGYDQGTHILQSTLHEGYNLRTRNMTKGFSCHHSKNKHIC